jgi:hypothetical protein
MDAKEAMVLEFDTIPALNVNTRHNSVRDLQQ